LITVVKLGGELLEDRAAMQAAAAGIAALAREGSLAVVHGGGRAIDADLRARGKSPLFVDGLRVTDEDTLATVIGVLAGRINTSLVAALSGLGVRAVGLTGADAATALCRRAPALQAISGAAVDLGLVGLPEQDGGRLLEDLLSLAYVPVLASIGVTREGELLNVNADVLAAHVARTLRADRLIIAGSTPGVLNAAGETCRVLDIDNATAMVAAGTARDGMVAKLGACLDALGGGVKDVRIVDGRGADYLAANGTRIQHHAHDLV
jgi:acetylglutamate kinase